MPSPSSSLTLATVEVIVLVTLGYLPATGLTSAFDVATTPPTAGLVSLLAALLTIGRRA